jgi:hypothetical protein
MTYLIHVANIAYVFSYLVRDILWLRVLTLLGGALLLAFYVLQPMPLWAALDWNVLFLAINLWQIHVLLLERRPVRLEPRALRLYQLGFRSLTPREFSKLLGIARWEDVAAGARIVEKGQDLDRVMVVADGSARVEVGGGRAPIDLRPGQFVGEMSYLTGERPNADVVACEAVSLLSWKRDDLRAALARNADLRAAVQMCIGADLAVKLRPA